VGRPRPAGQHARVAAGHPEATRATARICLTRRCSPAANCIADRPIADTRYASRRYVLYGLFLSAILYRVSAMRSGWRKQQGQARRGELPDGDQSG
jgi:hypothetical protein